MQNNSQFTIYNASAGAGKTYTLVKEYLQILLASTSALKCREMLAITFTNKAVDEMKSRIIETLLAFSKFDTSTNDTPPMLGDLCKSLNKTPLQISTKSHQVLKTIIHNYAAFDVVTIDALTARVLRTFARDLNLDANFNISLDIDGVLNKTVALVLDQAGKDKTLTEALINYALEKTDDDKSWNIKKDLIDIAKLLLNENDTKATAAHQNIKIETYKAVKKDLQTANKKLLTQIKNEAQGAIDLIHNNGLDQKSFNRGSFYTHLKKVITTPETVTFDSWRADVENHNLYSKSQSATIKATIDHLKPELLKVFYSTKKAIQLMLFYKGVLSKFSQLSVLNELHRTLNRIKTEENILLISDFNQYIYNHLKNEPAAFIYERLGERYKHYFIDEFQDTSLLQWDNLTPLIENKLSQLTPYGEPNHSLLLVGDPKQSIYRWRGGNAEQFITLSKKQHPFSLEDHAVTIAHLDTNFRSSKAVVNFNNSFYQYISQHIEHPEYQKLYFNDNNQKIIKNLEGYVSIDLIDPEEDTDTQYKEVVLNHIKELTLEGIKLSDICVLTRKTTHSKLLAEALVAHGYPVISPDSLLISNSPIVQLLIAILQLLVQPEDGTHRFTVLSYLSKNKSPQEVHHFYKSLIDLPNDQFLEQIGEISKIPNLQKLIFEPLSNCLEILIRAFNLNQNSDGYLFAFSDIVFEYSHTQDGGLQGFLEYWASNEQKLTLQTPKTIDAIQLMTIHKSKGLGFPIVIYPYVETPLFNSREHHWYQTEAPIFKNINPLLIPHSLKIAQFDEQTNALYMFKKLEQAFDSINMLYVATTRAINRLYIISSRKTVKKNNPIPQNFAQLITEFLNDQKLLNDTQAHYCFGKKEASAPSKTATPPISLPYISSAMEKHGIAHITKKSATWDQNRLAAITHGNLIHYILECIDTKDNINEVLNQLVYEGAFAKADTPTYFALVNQVVLNPKLKACFNNTNIVYKEKAILLPSGKRLIPDRLEITPNNAAYILDYKTGKPQQSHKSQIYEYADALHHLGYTKVTKQLIYIDQEIKVMTV